MRLLMSATPDIQGDERKVLLKASIIDSNY